MSCHLRDAVKKEKIAVEMKLRAAVTFGLKTDSWTSELTSRQYITATSSFSLARRTIEERRTQLSRDTADLVLHGLS